MKFYTFLVCRQYKGFKCTDDLCIRAKDIGHALAHVWALKGYVSCQYIGKAH
jgi:hypothetical protein